MKDFNNALKNQKNADMRMNTGIGTDGIFGIIACCNDTAAK